MCLSFYGIQFHMYTTVKKYVAQSHITPEFTFRNQKNKQCLDMYYIGVISRTGFSAGRVATLTMTFVLNSRAEKKTWSEV